MLARGKKLYRNTYAWLLTSILIFSPCLHATQQFSKFWSLLTINSRFDRWNFYVEPQLRLVTPGNVFQQFLYNMGAGYEFVPGWQFWLGETNSTDSQDAVPGDQDEVRLWEQILWNHRFKTFTLISRSRLENRYSLFFPPWAFRFRQRFLIHKPINPNWSWVFYDETFFNLNQVSWIITQAFDQNRAFIGLDKKLTPLLNATAGYMNQYLSTTNPQINHTLLIWVTLNLDY